MVGAEPALQIAAYRFLARAVDPVVLPPNAGSTLRGGLGSALRRAACFQRGWSEGCNRCPGATHCPYSYVFETPPAPDSEVLRSLREVPHPFVLEPPEAPPPVYPPGSALQFRVVLVGRAIAHLPYFVVAFARLGEGGIGRGRGRFALEEVRAEHPLDGRWERVYRDGRVLPCGLDLTATYPDLLARCRDARPERVAVSFRTPTRLVSEERLVMVPTFAVLVRSALRRISALSYFHCGRRWVTDYRAMVAAAERVRTARSELQWVDWERYSSRQGARMKLGGLVGSAEYEGEVAAFLPLLLAASAVHLGKACTFGNGRIDVEW